MKDGSARVREERSEREMVWERKRNSRKGRKRNWVLNDRLRKRKRERERERERERKREREKLLELSTRVSKIYEHKSFVSIISFPRNVATKENVK